MKYMPLMKTGLAIRFDLLSEKQAKINHGQTLDRLAERGGLSLCEAVALVEERQWRRMDMMDALKRLRELSSDEAKSPQEQDK